MVEFIIWLKALAALLITNSHLCNVYPDGDLANGGLLGNLLFFAISGYCLYNVRINFISWYLRRLVRIYPALWFTSAICIFIGLYPCHDWHQILSFFLYPTYYHFIASILLLYIPFYFSAKIIGKTKRPGKHIMLFILSLIAIYALIYIFAYDKSYYHIDVVEENFIRLPYFIAMLLGALFRINDGNKSPSNAIAIILLPVSLIIYILSKQTIASNSLPSAYQWITQASIMILLYTLFSVARQMEAKLSQCPGLLKAIPHFIGRLTLEIYMVQYLVIIPLQKLSFPANLFLILLFIPLTAYIIHKVCNIAISRINQLPLLSR